MNKDTRPSGPSENNDALFNLIKDELFSNYLGLFKDVVIVVENETREYIKYRYDKTMEAIKELSNDIKEVKEALGV